MNLFWQSFIQIEKEIHIKSKGQKIVKYIFRPDSHTTKSKLGYHEQKWYLMGVKLVNTEFHFITVGLELIR